MVMGSGLRSQSVAMPTRRQAVVERLRTAIVTGELAPGSLLREIEVAQSLGVSPTPVREAFGELASEGLVEIEAHRLKRVSPINPKAMLDLLRVQAELWRLGYVWGMPRMGPAEFDVLDRAISDYRGALDTADAFGMVRAGHDFSAAFIIASGNSELLRSTLDRRALLARFILHHGRATLSRRGLRQYQAMAAALRRDDQQAVLAGLGQIADRLFALTEDAAAGQGIFIIRSH